MEKGYSRCKACDSKDRLEKWLALPRVEWDGETPLCVWDDDRFFFHDGDLGDYLHERAEEEPDFSLEDVRLVLCEQDRLPEFDMEEWLGDQEATHEDGPELDCKDIDRIINEWIKANVTPLWYPTAKAVSVESLRQHFPDLAKKEV